MQEVFNSGIQDLEVVVFWVVIPWKPRITVHKICSKKVSRMTERIATSNEHVVHVGWLVTLTITYI